MSASHFSPWSTSPKPCWHCDAYAGMAPDGYAALCTRPHAPRVRSMPNHGCSAFAREPGADDEPEWKPVSYAPAGHPRRPGQRAGSPGVMTPRASST